MITKDTFWKIYALTYILLLIIFVFDIRRFTAWEYISLILEIITHTGFILYLWNKQTLHRYFWLATLFIYLIYMNAYNFLGLGDTFYNYASSTGEKILVAIAAHIIIYPKVESIFMLVVRWNNKEKV